MALPSSVRSSDRWTITDVGRVALHNCDVCSCRPRIVGLLVQCPDCGTVYGSLREREDLGQVARGKPA